MSPDLYLTHRPAPPLDRFVERLWYWQSAAPVHARDRIMPDGSGSLIVNLSEDEVRNFEGAHDEMLQRFPGAVLVGAYSRYSVIDTQQQQAVLGAMLSEHVGLSTRRLARLFTLEVGMTPKLYSRIKRFERVLSLMRSAQSVDWSELALNCGYFDQSHLIRDCKAISGFTPADLQRRPSSGGHHVAV